MADFARLTRRVAPAPESVWHDRAFVTYWLGSSVSVAGSWITYAVLPILVYQLTGSAFQTSLVAALEVLPYLIFGLPAGALADRLDRRRLMISCDVINALVIASIPLAHALGVLTLPHVYVAAFLAASAFVWFDAANFGALPALVGKDRLVAAQSAVWSSWTAIGIIAPSLGGLLAATVGAAPTLTVDALSYVVSAVALLLVARPFSLQEASGAQVPAIVAPLARMRAEIAEGLSFLWRERIVRTLTLLGFGVAFSGGAVFGLTVVYAVEALALPQDDGRIGLLFSAGAAGSLAASLLLPRLTRRLPAARITLIGLPFDFVLILAVAAAPGLLVALALLFLWNAVHLLIILNGIALRQLVTPDRLQGRVNTTARMIAWGGTPFGAIVAGVLTEFVGVRAALALAAVAVGTSATAAWFSPLRESVPIAEP
ncbi:MAG: MFS transporter [Gaiellaceae bacterium MAG52_C11]|nr:MFS transporter [Candidatus Gaiellasilicea maunaloa]